MGGWWTWWSELFILCCLSVVELQKHMVTFQLALPLHRFLWSKTNNANLKNRLLIFLFSRIGLRWIGPCFWKGGKKCYPWNSGSVGVQGVVCLRCYYSCFVHRCWFMWSQRSEQDLSWERKSKRQAAVEPRRLIITNHDLCWRMIVFTV